MRSPGDEVKRAREAARLSIRALAERAGVTRGYLSKVENGHAFPSWEILQRIAGAFDCEPHLRLLPSGGSIAARAKQLATMTLQERLAGHDSEPEEALRALVDSGVAFAVTGSVAGVLQGLPMSIDTMTVIVRNDPEALDALVDMLVQARALFRAVDGDELRRMSAVGNWPIGWCDVRFEFAAELPPTNQVRVGRIDVPVVPLTTLVAEDHDAADVFDMMRAVLSG